MPAQVIGQEARNEIITMVVARPQVEREGDARIRAGLAQQFGAQLRFEELVVRTLIDQQFGQAQETLYIDQCFELVRSGKVVLNDIITHRLPLSKAADAYDMFKHKDDGWTKVVLHP